MAGSGAWKLALLVAVTWSRTQCTSLDDNLLDAVVDAVGPCDAGGGGLACQGLRLARRVGDVVRSEGPLELAEGVTLVRAAAAATSRGARGDTGDMDVEGVPGVVAKFLQERELRVTLPRLVGDEQWNSFLNSSLVRSGGPSEGRGKKDKGGSGLVLAMGGMMMSLMGAMGFAALAMLAMKAIGLAAMALMLAAAAGLKKMAGGDEGGHHVSVVPVGGHGDHGYHHRRRRSEAHDVAYSAWRPV